MRAASMLALALLAGCAEQKMAESGPPLVVPTYSGQIQGLIHQRCAGCHQPGNIAPFSLLTLDDLMQHLDAVSLAIAGGAMPPMPATDQEDCPTIDDARVMPDAERRAFLDWVAGGTPLGSPAAPLPTPDQDGPLGPPTATYPMPADYVAPTSQQEDEYRCFLIDPQITEILPVSAVSVVPGNQKIVHHATVYLVSPTELAAARALDAADGSPGYTCFGGVGTTAYAAGAWVPGYAPQLPPRPGLGGWILPGWQLILQVHYNFTNIVGEPRPVTDRSAVTVWRATEPVTETASVLTLGDWAFTLPAGKRDIVRTVEGEVLKEGSLVGLGQVPEGLIYVTWAHEHLLGRSFQMDLVHADGSRQCLLHIPTWNFNWQGAYALKDPIATHAGDRVRVTCTWDNGTGKDVGYGETTGDEMCIGTLGVMKFE
jgi:hypothetical protein